MWELGTHFPPVPHVRRTRPGPPTAGVLGSDHDSVPRKNHRVTDLGEAGHLGPRSLLRCVPHPFLVFLVELSKVRRNTALVSIGTGI